MNKLLKYIDETLKGLGYFLSPKLKEEHTRIAEIEKQMEFWHKEETRLINAAFDAYRKGDSQVYEHYRTQFNIAHNRCNQEVRKPLGTLRKNLYYDE